MHIANTVTALTVRVGFPWLNYFSVSSVRFHQHHILADGTYTTVSWRENTRTNDHRNHSPNRATLAEVCVLCTNWMTNFNLLVSREIFDGHFWRWRWPAENVSHRSMAPFAFKIVWTQAYSWWSGIWTSKQRTSTATRAPQGHQLTRHLHLQWRQKPKLQALSMSN